MQTRFPDAFAFLEGRRFGTGPTYVLGGRADSRVTVVTQQRRALNIVAALQVTQGPDLLSKRVAIVGAGASGLTAAAALRGIRVDNITVFEVAAAPLHAQRASYSRFLHPNLFHWPEAGWQHDHADLPVGDWSAGYADSVRDEILSTTGDGITIRYCTTVDDIAPVEDTDPAATTVELTVRKINEDTGHPERFDLVLVATGFPAEKRPNRTLGGSYWHQLEIPANRHVHVIGDGDGALTEVLMLYIRQFGHAAVVDMARRLPETADLRRADLEAHGARTEHTPDPNSARVDDLVRDLEVLDPGQQITLHSRDALKGGSFLLNRVLFHHLQWARPRSVFIGSENVSEQDAGNLDGTPVWRTGIPPSQPKAFESPTLATRAVVDAIATCPLIPVSSTARGVLAHAIDALRRRLWDDTFHSAAGTNASGWTPTGPTGLRQANGQSSQPCRDALVQIVAAAIELDSLGIALRVDSFDRDPFVVSIETVVRTMSIPHDDCIDKSDSSDLREDKLGRLWFKPRIKVLHDYLESANQQSGNTRRSAVAALVDPTQLHASKLLSKRRKAAPATISEDNPAMALDNVSRETLNGLSDLSTVEPAILDAIWLAHFRRHEFEDAVDALLRRARLPAGRGRTAGVGSRTRISMLDTARVLAAAPNGAGPFQREDRWVLIAAAASDLTTLGPRGQVDLTASEKFIQGTWAPRVRGILRSSTEPPQSPFEFVAQLADQPPEQPIEFKSVQAQAGEALRGARPENHAAIAQFGVQTTRHPLRRGGPQDHKRDPSSPQ